MNTILADADKDLREFLKTVVVEMDKTIECIQPQVYTKSVQLITEAEDSGHRLHITGIGKPSHIASYLSSLFSSVGTKSYYLDAVEAVHGSSGQLEPGDVVICISNSGETMELKATVQTIKNNDCKVIAVTGNSNSWLSREADATLIAKVQHEGGPLNRAPRVSILSELLVLQGLSVVLQSKKNITPEMYVRWHPGGQLGKLRDGEIPR